MPNLMIAVIIAMVFFLIGASYNEAITYLNMKQMCLLHGAVQIGDVILICGALQ